MSLGRTRTAPGANLKAGQLFELLEVKSDVSIEFALFSLDLSALFLVEIRVFLKKLHELYISAC